MQNLVPLERHFYDLDDEALADADFSWAWSGYGTLRWADVLASPRVLLLAEAGTGKTAECQMQQQRLSAEGQSAFWIELASLARVDLTTAVDEADRARFEAWLHDPAKVATFFLDSVDELLLTKAKFEFALKAVARGVGDRLDRARFVVTSRPASFDRDALARILPYPDRPAIDIPVDEPGAGFVEAAMGDRPKMRRMDDPQPPPTMRAIGLMPLTTKEAHRLAVVVGVTDPDAFIGALVQNDVMPFARRPQDLIELANAWVEQGRLPTHREQVRLNAIVKLRPAEDRDDHPLPNDRALAGAQALALAMLLTRRLVLRHSAASSREPGRESVLDPREILEGWSEPDLRALLERPLFGHAGYGRVRFHHRSVVEFLAAQQLADLLAGGAPWRNIAALLFAQTAQGIEVLRPTMRPTAVWLAARSRPVFDEVLRIEPHALLQYGDPESLDERDRQRAVAAYIALAGSRNREGVAFAPEQVQRFACTEVLTALPGLWHAGLHNPDARHLVFQLFAAQPTNAGTRIAFDVLTDATADQLERMWAAEVVAAADDARLPALVAQLAVDASAWPDEVAASVATRLLPQHLAPEQLCTLLSRMAVGRNSPGRDLARSMSYRIADESFDDAYLSQLRDGLVTIVLDGMQWSRTSYPHYQSSRPDLAELLAAVCMRLLASQGLGLCVETLAACLIAVQASNPNLTDHGAVGGLRDLASKWPPSLRRVAYAAGQALLVGIHGQDDPFDRHIAFDQAGLLQLSPAKDAEWVMNVLGSPEESPWLRAGALEAALQGIGLPAAPAATRLRKIASAVDDLPCLLAQVESLLQRRKEDPRIRTMQANQTRHRIQQEMNEANRRDGWRTFARKILEKPAAFFAPDKAQTAAWNIWKVMRKVETTQGGAGWNRAFVERELNPSIANQLKAALRNTWRREKPSLPHERPADGRNATQLGWAMGNTALAAESEDAGWATKLTKEEAALAARYIPIELNRFPPWLPDLVHAHPAPVRAILIQLVDDELKRLNDAGEHPTTLQHLEYGNAAVRELVMPHLEAWLTANAKQLAARSTPIQPTYGCQRLARLVLEHGSSRAHTTLLRLSLKALARPAIGGWELLWFHVAFTLNPAAATPILETRLTHYPVGRLGEGAQLLAGLFGDRHESMQVGARGEAFTPALRLRLTRLAYTHVRREDDWERRPRYDSGAGRNAREAAQHGRDALLGALLDAEGPGAWEAKVALAADPLIGTFADRARALSLAHEARVAEGAPLAPVQVQRALHGTVVPPATREQMFALLSHRLDELEDMLKSDASPRETWARTRIERELRRLIAHELETMAHGAYTVIQEAVSADEKETDIRLLSTSSAEAGVIELKVGENASGADLRATIQDQLVRKYLQPEHRRAGYLVVTVGSDEGWLHPESRQRLDADGLRQLLSEEAARVEQAMRGQVSIGIRVLDLRPTLAIERPSRRRSRKR
jgi:hypothetical protein